MTRHAHRRTGRQGGRGVAMVEFALVAPLFFLLLFGIIDFGRYTQVNNTVAEAARQGARQAIPDATAADSPFTGAPNGTCSGQTFTYQQSSTQGCLTDAAILATVQRVMSGVLAASNITLKADTTPAQCSALTAPAVGSAYVCISPGQSSTTATTTCSNGVVSPAPAPAAVSRSAEYAANTFQGCYYISVTVLYRYQAWTPLLSRIIGVRTVTSTTTMLAEY